MQKDFYQCKKCHALHLGSISDANGGSPFSECDNCGYVDVQKVTGDFLINCPKCFEFWPTRVIKLIHKEGLLHCPSLTCDGLLKLRIHKKESIKESVDTVDNKKSGSKHQSRSSSNLPIPAHDIVVRMVSQTEEKPSSPLLDVSEPIMAGGLDTKPTPSSLPQPKPLKSLKAPKPSQPAVGRPKLDFNLDFSQLKSHINVSQAKTLLSRFKTQECDLFCSFLSKDYYQGVFTSYLVSLYDKTALYIREPIQNVFYVGELQGDYTRLKLLINFFVPLIETYPSVKVVFLGNYFGMRNKEAPNQIAAFLALCLFSLVYPENVVILRGKDDYEEGLDAINLYGMINTNISQEKVPKAIIFTLILNILKHLPVFHIGSMNQGQLNVYSSHTGIPLNKDDLTPLKLTIFSKWNFLEHASFSKQNINPYLAPIYNPLSELQEGGLKQFFIDNALHYMVNSGNKVEKQDVSLTLVSHGSSPQIGRLQPGNAPELLDIDPSILKKSLEETFGIFES